MGRRLARQLSFEGGPGRPSGVKAGGWRPRTRAPGRVSGRVLQPRSLTSKVVAKTHTASGCGPLVYMAALSGKRPPHIHEQAGATDLSTVEELSLSMPCAEDSNPSQALWAA